MTLPAPSYNDNLKSFAFLTVRQRWPTILQGAIDDINTHSSEAPDSKKCGDKVISQINELLHAFKNDDEVASFLTEDVKQFPHLKVYNDMLDEFNAEKQVTWLTGPWLFLECYLYQLLHLWFQHTLELKNFDVFETLKTRTFKQSSLGVLELCKRYETLSIQLKDKNVEEQTLKLLFIEFIDISLWGNATDLSLLAGNVSLEDIQSVQGAEVRKKNEEKIIVNDVAKAWNQLSGSSRTRIDVVLDNSGFELFADLCLALFTLDSNLAQSVVLHCKEIPWFVSDTMPKDFDALLDQLQDSTFFPECFKTEADKEAMTYLHTRLMAYFKDGKISTQHHPFWTSCENYWYIPEHPDLYDELKKSDLIIFKGDLNYRKLTGDLEWDTTTPFETAIQDLATSKLPVLSLRTCKADVVVGLPEGLNAKLVEVYKEMGNDVGEFWTASGKWAVISFNNCAK